MNKRYPWKLLKVPGDFFLWPHRKDEASLRSQANKQGKRRSVVFSVRVVDQATLQVTYERGIL